LRALGNCDPTTRADHPTAAAFKKGDRKSYVVFNPGKEALAVRFSDGVTVRAAAGLSTHRP
jgi:hypothetical protein